MLWYISLFIPVIISLFVYDVMTIQMFIALIIMAPFAPLIPMTAGALVGILIAVLSSKFKKSTMFETLINLGFVLLVYYIVFNSSYSMGSMNIADMMLDALTKYYPVAVLYNNAIVDFNIIGLIGFIVISMAVFYALTVLISKNFRKLNSNFASKKEKSDYKFKMQRINSPLIALFKKEWKKFTSIPMYMLNTAIIPILLIAGSLYLLFNADKFSPIIEAMPSEVLEVVGNITAIATAMVVSTSITTNASISLEGKTLDLLKSLPVKTMDVFNSKIMVNLAVTIPTILIVQTICVSIAKFDTATTVAVYLLPLVVALYSSFLGLYINILLPKYNYVNEDNVIKASMAVNISVLLDMFLFLGVIAIFINYGLGLTEVYITILIFAVVSAILYALIATHGVKKFQQSSNG